MIFTVQKMWLSIKERHFLTVTIFYVFFIVSMISYYFIAPFTILYGLRILAGVIVLLFIPGYFIVSHCKLSFGLVEKIGFSTIFGLALQNFNTFFLWLIFDNLPLSFVTIIYLLTAFETTIFFVFLRAVPTKHSLQFEEKNDVFPAILMLTFISGLFIRLWYQGFNTRYITPDGAYYSDFARNIVEKNIFVSSRMDPDFYRNFLDQHGYLTHIFVPFTLAIFFIVGGVNYFSAKLAVLFSGSLLVFPTYALSKVLFSKRAGILAAFAIALHPTLIYYSSILFGNEMINNLYFLVAFFFLINDFVHSRFLYPVLGGVFLFLSRMTWYQAGFFLPIFPFITLLFSRRDRGKVFVFTVILSGLTFFLFETVQPNDILIRLAISLLIGATCVLGLKRKELHMKEISIFFLSYVLLMDVQWARLFRHGEFFSLVPPTPQSLIPFSDISTRVQLWIQKSNEIVGYPLLILGVASFLMLSRVKATLAILSYPFLYSALFILYNPYDFEDRFFVPIIIFTSIASPSLMEVLYTLARKQIKLNTKIDNE